MSSYEQPTLSEERIAEFEAIRSHLPEEKKGDLERRITLIRTLRNQLGNALDESGRRLRMKDIETHADTLKAIEQEGIALRAALEAIVGKTAGRVHDLLEGELSSLKEEMEQLGGSTRQETRKVLSRLNLQDYWFEKFFGKLEVNVFEKYVFPRMNTPRGRLKRGDINLLDIGSGIGRASKEVLTAFSQFLMSKEVGFNKEEATAAMERAAGRLQAIDIMPRFVEETRTTLEKFGVPKSQIIEADFMDLPPQLQRGDIDLAYAPMHTLWHATTEADLMHTLEGIRQALRRPTTRRNGGLLLLDTVGLFYHQGIPSQKIIRNMNDLEQFYGVLTRVYRQRYLETGTDEYPPEGPMARCPIYDNTARIGFYAREVITRDYLMYLLNKMDGGLEFRYGGLPMERFNNSVPDDQCETLGRQWIRDNTIEPWLRAEIAFRLSQMDLEEIQPLYALGAQEREEVTRGLDTLSPAVDEKLRAIIIRMVKCYVQHYYLLERAK